MIPSPRPFPLVEPPQAPLPVQDLILLGILMDGPQHGYEMRLHLERRLGTIATITGGTIYYTLRKLERGGYVRMKRNREGNRPERMVYTITPAGRDYFQDLLRRSFFVEDLPYTTFDVGFYFLAHASLDDALAGAERQIERLRAYQEHVGSLERDYPFRWPFRMEAIKQHTLGSVRAHTQFYRELCEDLRARIARARSRRPATLAAAAAGASRRRAHHG